VHADQKAEVRVTPPRWLIPWITSAQVWIYETSNGRLGATGAGMPHLLLRTVGRKSGRELDVCLPYWLDEDGSRIVVASFAGGPRNPAWYHNVKDKRANPDVRVRDRDRVFRARADVLEGEERARVWRALIADRPFYQRYQDRTAREIPLVRLREADARG